MKSNNREKYPKVLVISNNPFSKTSNNGKTLASFFKDFPPEKIAQLYFSSETPSEEHYENYYRISDSQVFKSLYSHDKVGSIVDVSLNVHNIDHYDLSISAKTNSVLKSNFGRLLRELMWKSNKWNSGELVNWIKEYSPDVVFFCAGDTGFAYDIVSYVLDITDAKLITYITDDYILPRRTISLLWWIRRYIIFRKMNSTVSRSNLFITISEQMRNTYKDIFDKDSILALNITESMKIDDYMTDDSEDNTINLIYAGGLHFKRYETLSLLAESINNYNSQSINTRAFLSIYSTKMPLEKELKKVNIKGASEFLGSLNIEELKTKLNEADILVHVESFNLKSIESTRLSISTKIPEYLSLGKPILAIGPEEVASMKSLEGVGFCITNPQNINEKLALLIEDKNLKKDLSLLALEKYNVIYNSTISGKELHRKILELVAK